MDEAKDIDPVALLQAMEAGCRAAATGLPGKVEPREEWSGIAFRLGAWQLLVTMGEVVEALPVPRLSVVPHTAEWVRGIANIRGRLLPVFDLHCLLLGEPGTLTPRSRVLVIETGSVYCGLVVDEVYGLRHYPVEARTAAGDRADPALAPWVREGFPDGEVFRCIFSISALAASPAFMQAAI